MFSRLAVTGATVGESEKVLDTFDSVGVVFDDGLAIVELVEETTFGSSSASRDVNGEEVVSVSEKVSNDVTSEFVNCTIEVKVSTVREESRVVSRVEVSCRVKSRRVFRTVEGRVDAEEVVVRINTGATDRVNRAIMFRLFD